MGDSSPRHSLGASAASSRASLPRIRASPLPLADSQPATPPLVDIVSPLPSPPSVDGAPPPPRQLDANGRLSRTRPSVPANPSTRPLVQMLAGDDAAERCRWSGLVMAVFYVITVLLWPSLFVSFLGIVCGCTGFTACLEPYTVQRLVGVFVYVFLNAAMVVVLAWTVIDQMILQRDGEKEVNYLYVSAFVLVAGVVHVRSLGSAVEVIRKCKLVDVIAGTALPENWRRRRLQLQPPRELASDGEDEDDTRTPHETEVVVSDPRPSETSSVNSFELDLQWNRSNVSAPAHVPSPVSSPVSSPVVRLESPTISSYQRLEDAHH